MDIVTERAPAGQEHYAANLRDADWASDVSEEEYKAILDALSHGEDDPERAAYVRKYERLGLSMVELHGVKNGVCTCAKGAACPSAGKHPVPVGWVSKATTNANEILQRIGTKTCNIGLAMGHGFVVLDVDGEEGEAALEELEAKHGKLPAGPRQTTGSGGAHYLFRTSHVFTNRVKFRAGLDIRSAGGQIVAAPSMHKFGRRYEWKGLFELQGADAIPELPDWLAAEITEGNVREGGARRPAEDLGYPDARPSRELTDAEIATIARGLEGHPPAIDGQGGTKPTGAAIAKVIRAIFSLFGWHRYPPRYDEAMKIVPDGLRAFEPYNARCEPPWDLDGRDGSEHYFYSMLHRVLDETFEREEFLAAMTGEPARPPRGVADLVREVRGAGDDGVHTMLKSDAFMRDAADLGAADLSQVKKSFKERGVNAKTFDGSMKEWLKDWNRRVDAAGPATSTTDTRPVIHDSVGNEHRTVPQVLEALRRDRNLFVHCRRLVTVVGHDPLDVVDPPVRRDAGTPIVASVAKGELATRIAAVARFERFDARTKDYVQKPVTPAVLSAIHEASSWPGLPELTAIATSPVFRPDGSVLTAPGYDPDSGVFHQPSTAVVVPEAPTQEDAIAARDALLEIVADFPFEAERDRAVWFAAVLTAIGRGAFEGQSGPPMFLVDAAARGTGKSMLVDTISILATGRRAPRSQYAGPSGGRGGADEEMRKRMLAHCRGGDTMVLIDNVPDGAPIGWPVLDSALTGGEVQDRILGKSETVTVPHRIVWFATGNNLSVAGDLERRALRCRMVSTEERPELRTDFQHPDLLGWVRAERARLLGAALTILRAYVLAGSPRADVRGFGSFEAWSDVIRQAVLWVGMPDPVENSMANLGGAAVDPVAEAHGALLEWLRAQDPRGVGMTALEILQHAQHVAHVALKGALLGLCPDKLDALPNTRRLGNTLSKLRDRVRTVGTLRLALDRIADANGHAVRWRAKPIV